VVSDALARAYRACAQVAAAHYENFPVASCLLPAPMRPHVAAVYAFARIADDIADEGADPPDVRQVRLREWRRRLHEAARAPGPSSPDARSRDDLVFAALGHSIRALQLPLDPFDDLLSAFAQDTTTVRYDSWADLFDYCRRSANPVGRLVLRIGGYTGSDVERSSDALCTALQLANFWQDFGRDWRAGRLYVPREVQQASRASIDDLAHGHLTHEWVDALRACIARTRPCFEAGRRVCDGVRGRLKLELRLTWLGGRRILERVDQQCVHLLSERPTLGARDLPVLLWRAAAWRQVSA
jgi:squalene synthase HpnC